MAAIPTTEFGEMLLTASKINVSFGRKRVLTDLSMAIDGASIIGLVAPNGEGKTTLLKVLAGLIPQPKGSVLADKISPYSAVAYKRKVFFAEDVSILNPSLNALDYLRFIKREWRSDAHIDEVIEMLGIAEFSRVPIRKLSLGMKQQVIIAMSLESDANYLLLDEPMNGLDPTRTKIVSEQFKTMRGLGKTIVMSSHLLDNIDAIADRVCFIKDGAVFQTNFDVVNLPSRATYNKLYDRAGCE